MAMVRKRVCQRQEIEAQGGLRVEAESAQQALNVRKGAKASKINQASWQQCSTPRRRMPLRGTRSAANPDTETAVCIGISLLLLADGARPQHPTATPRPDPDLVTQPPSPRAGRETHPEPDRRPTGAPSWPTQGAHPAIHEHVARGLASTTTTTT
ncbi:hypothetical protein CKAH01_04217 [Colletotrichum kahawae]|uniref:Uncharacterized protein n=1 Tax=Colletotrichum kahawae TaxID=34407 RepID=A0AAD9YNE4_COLKA|nr:hypothetical protein CKAH01_04217 [Colletotrichum kahawae]